MNDRYTGSGNLEVMLEADRYNSFLKELVREHAGSARRVLDFGAGIGTFTDAIQLPPETIHCVEPDLEAQEILRSRGYQVHASLDEVTGPFDYIFTLNVLEHIEDDEAIARSLFNLLEPGGTLLVYVPAFNHLWTSMDNLVSHCRRYTRDTLSHVLLAAGFSVERNAYTDFLGYFATLAFRLADSFRDAPDGQLNRPLLIAYDRVFFPVSRLLSRPFGRLLGKNVYALARRPA